MRRAFRLGLGPGHVASAVDEELAFHIDMRARKLIDGGLSAADAHREALRQFGDLQRTRQSCVTLDEEHERSMTRIRHADELGQDISFAVRALRRNPAFAIIAILTLALGIGANTAIFTLIDAIMLRPIPVRAPAELVVVGDPSAVNWMSVGSARSQIFSYPLYRDIVERNTVLSGVAGTGISPRADVQVDSGSTSEAEHPAARLVSANYFSVLGVPAARGRVFGASEEGIAPISPVVVISDQYWAQRFDRDPSIVGRVIRVNHVALTIVGVTPPGFEGEVIGKRYEMWFPISMQPALRPRDGDLLSQRNSSWLLLIGRRAPGVTFDQARTSLSLTLRRALTDHASGPGGTAAIAKLPILISSGEQGISSIRNNYRGPLFTMLAGVGLLLLIICANVANLLLARAVARTPEFSVRLAMGAGRGRLLRQLLTESAVLAGASAITGLAIAWVASRGLLVLAADGGTAIPLALPLDTTVLAFTVGMSIISAALFGLMPAFRTSRLDLAANLRARGVTGGLGARGQRFPIGTLMITGQIALSLVLLMSAALLVRNLRALETTEVNVDRDHLLMVSIDAAETGLRGQAGYEMIGRLRERLARVPGVSQASYSANGLFNGSDLQTTLTIPHWSGRTHDDSSAHLELGGPEFLTTIGARLIAGRDIQAVDVRFNAAPIAIVNQSFARFYFGGANPIGQTINAGNPVPATIVGVVADIRDQALDNTPVRRYYAAFQADTGAPPPADLRFAVRTIGDPSAVIDAVRRTVHSENPLLKIDGAVPLATLMSRSVTEQRVLTRVASAFGILALLLAAIGLYGVMTYAVTRRTGEIGLRIALGASPRGMVGMVVGDAMRLVGMGTLIGIPLALGASRLLGNQFHGVKPPDPLAGVVTLAVLSATAIVAALVPAWRAAAVEPLAALRQQ